MTSPMQSKQGSGSRNLVRLCSHGWRVKKPSLIERVFPAPKAGRVEAPEASKWLASFMPLGDERSTAESHPRCGGGFAFAPPSKAVLPAENDRGSYTTNNCVDTLSVREGSGCFDHSSLSHLCSPSLFLICRTSRDNPAPISRLTGVSVIAISSSRAAQGTYHRAPPPQLCT